VARVIDEPFSLVAMRWMNEVLLFCRLFVELVTGILETG
jgi:hypothetical protein